MDSRIGTPTHHMLQYKENPDDTINSNGRSLKKILENNKKMFIVNGLIHKDIDCETDFTFFRNNTQSQNDICIANSTEEIRSLHILPKLIESDHRPFSLSLKTKFSPDLQIVNHCARTFRNYDHYDINKRIMRPIQFHKIDTTKLHEDLNNLAADLRNDMISEKGVNYTYVTS